LSKRIYVGNLPFSTTDEDLEQLFAQHGQVDSARVITDSEFSRADILRRFDVPDIGVEDGEHQHGPAQVGDVHLDPGCVGAERCRGGPWSEVAFHRFQRCVDNEHNVVDGPEVGDRLPNVGRGIGCRQWPWSEAPVG